MRKGNDALIWLIVKLLLQIIVTGWSYVCFAFFILYYYKNDGLTSMFFPLLVFLYFMVEEKIGAVLVWKISFVYVSILILFKFINSLPGLIYVSPLDDPTSYSITIFFNSSSSSLLYEGFLNFLIYIQLTLIRRMGLSNKVITQEENTHMCYLRMKVNKFISLTSNAFFLESQDKYSVLPKQINCEEEQED